jgi:hypothetical protein
MSPTFLAESVWSVDLDVLARAGVRGIILDLDNTIVDWGETWVRPQVAEWISAARDRGFRLCIVSNALGGARVHRVGEELGLTAVLRSGKPFPGAFRKGMQALGTDPGSTCAIGDQVFTDILGANWARVASILVPPLSPRESPHTRLIRLLEGILRRRWAGRVASIDARGR